MIETVKNTISFKGHIQRHPILQQGCFLIMSCFVFFHVVAKVNPYSGELDHCKRL